MNTFNYVACGNYFVAFDGKLVNVEVRKVILWLCANGNVVRYIAYFGERELTFTGDTKFFESVEMYKNDSPVSNTSAFGANDICRHLQCRFVEGDTFKGWVFNNKIAEELTFEVFQIEIEGTAVSIYGTDQHGRNIPKCFYWSRQDVLDNNVVKVVDKDGNESEMVGINVLTKLDEDQRAMADELEALIEKMRDSGMVIVFDDCNGCISAINSRRLGNVSTYCYAGDGDYDHELDYKDMTMIVNIDSRVDDSNVLGVMDAKE